MIIFPGNNKLAVMPTYNRMCRFSILMRLLTLFAIHKYYFCTYSVLLELQESECLAHKTYMHNYSRKLTFPGKSTIANARASPVTPAALSLCTRPECQTRSNALLMSQETARISLPESSA